MTLLQPILPREDIGTAERWTVPDVAPASRTNEAARPTVAELEDLAEQARREGFEQGLAQGRDAARTELRVQTTRLGRLCDALAQPLADIDDAVESELAQLAVLIARRVIGHSIRTQPETLLPLVRELIAQLPAGTRHLRIHVHPDDAVLLREHLGDLDERGWRIEESAQLQPGDCQLTSDQSRLDARVATRLEAVVDAVLDGEDTGIDTTGTHDDADDAHRDGAS